MKILAVHNHYRSSVPSGEKAVFLAETELLRRRGHEVITYEKHNDVLLEMSPAQLVVRAGMSAIWSRRAFSEVTSILHSETPHVAHFHNTFPQISPAAYYACQRAGVPVVQTVHNYRIACINGLLFRSGEICEDCLERGVVMGAIHGCYQASRIRSLPLVLGQYVHRRIGTYQKKIDVFIALTDFMRGKLVRMGIPADKIKLKPNFVDAIQTSRARGDYFIYAGRLDSMKGVKTIVRAARGNALGKVVVVGDGEMASTLENSTPDDLEYVGPQPLERTMELIARAKAMIVPSLLYEGFPRTIVEAYACGTPVIASDIGGLRDVVEDGKTGLLVPPGDAGALARACARMTRQRAAKLGENANAAYNALYTPERNYEQLMAIYRCAVGGPLNEVQGR